MFEAVVATSGQGLIIEDGKVAGDGVECVNKAN